MITSKAFRLLPLLLSASCSVAAPTDPGQTKAVLDSCYKYAALRPGGLSITGRLEISAIRGASFTGVLSAVEEGLLAPAKILTGPVTGQMIDSRAKIIDFTWVIASRQARRHLGPIDGQPGQWLDESTSQTGTYTLQTGCL